MAKYEKCEPHAVPTLLMDAMQLAIQSGMSTDQVYAISMINLVLQDCAHQHDPTDLLARCYRISKLMEREEKIHNGAITDPEDEEDE